MSMTLMVRAMHLKIGNPLRKLVLIKLADNANDLGQCWPSYQHIADQCEIAKSTVRKHIKDLESIGLLRIENRKGPKGNSSNIYHLTLDPMPSDSTPMPSDSTGGMPSDSTGISHSLESVNETVSKPDDLPNKIIDLWNTVKATEKTNWIAVDARTKKRISLTKQRIKLVSQRLADKKEEVTDATLLKWFTEFFITMANDQFYSGKQNNYKLEYGQFMTEDYFVKTIERLNER